MAILPHATIIKEDSGFLECEFCGESSPPECSCGVCLCSGCDTVHNLGCSGGL